MDKTTKVIKGDSVIEYIEKVLAMKKEIERLNETQIRPFDIPNLGQGVTKPAAEAVGLEAAEQGYMGYMAGGSNNHDADVRYVLRHMDQYMMNKVTRHPLYPVMVAAIMQAMYGKGMRHGGDTIPFMEQPWNHYAEMHGRGFLTGQAVKKLEEAVSTRNGEAYIKEVLGAIVYAGASILHEDFDSVSKISFIDGKEPNPFA